MKWIIIGLTLVFSFYSFAETYNLSQSVFRNSEIPFIAHTNYLVMNVNFPPIKKLLGEVNEKRKVPLINRGEAHITVITPVEFDQALKKKIKISEINEIAQASDIQESTFEITCLGKGNAVIDGKEESTFFIVVTSPKLVQIRTKIHQLFVKRGGASEIFIPEKYYPHITLGFTKRDLHESDGILKDKRSCAHDIKVY